MYILFSFLIINKKYASLKIYLNSISNDLVKIYHYHEH